jgi:hypothetical protein
LEGRNALNIAVRAEILKRFPRVRQVREAYRVNRIRPFIIIPLSIEMDVRAGEPRAIGVGMRGTVNIQADEDNNFSCPRLISELGEPKRSAPNIQKKSLLRVGPTSS